MPSYHAGSQPHSRLLQSQPLDAVVVADVDPIWLPLLHLVYIISCHPPLPVSPTPPAPHPPPTPTLTSPAALLFTPTPTHPMAKRTGNAAKRRYELELLRGDDSEINLTLSPLSSMLPSPVLLTLRVTSLPPPPELQTSPAPPFRPPLPTTHTTSPETPPSPPLASSSGAVATADCTANRRPATASLRTWPGYSTTVARHVLIWSVHIVCQKKCCKRNYNL